MSASNHLFHRVMESIPIEAVVGTVEGAVNTAEVVVDSVEGAEGFVEGEGVCP